MPTLILFPACGPNTFFGTWGRIVIPLESSSSEIASENLSSSMFEPNSNFLQINNKKIDSFSKIFGIPNRDGQILMLNDAGGETGISVSAGDFNNDGLDDIVLGAPESDGVLKDTSISGWVYMIFGKKNFSKSIDLKSDVDLSFWTGDDAGRNRLGHALTFADLNGDGIKDLIMGAPHHNGQGNQRIHSGAIFVVFGKSNLSGVVDLSRMADLIILGANTGDLTGFSIAAGNLNGDTEMDLIIGAPGSQMDDSSMSKVGSVYILYGRKNFPKVIDLSQNNNVRLAGIDGASNRMALSGNMADQAGFSVLLSDVNADGLDDILIGAPFADGFLNKGEEVGEVYVVLGKKILPPHLDLNRDADAIIFGSKNLEFFGKHLSSGDINGDGITDILISSPGAKIKSKDRFLNGIVFGIPGRNAWDKSIFSKDKPNKVYISNFWTSGDNYESAMSGKSLLDFGSSVIAIDLNKDKIDDLLIGVPGAPKKIFDFGAGAMSFFLSNNDKRRSQSSGIFQPPSLGPSESFGKSMALGDFNGDGRKDILIGAPGIIRNNQRSACGGAYIIFR